MGKYRAYPEYTESESEWWRLLPSHWRVSKLKHACTRITDGSHFSPHTIDDGLPYITVRNLINGRIDIDNAERISREDYIRLVNNDCRPNKGDILFSKDGTVGKVGYVHDNNFVVLSSLAILSPFPPKLNSHYLYYLLLSDGGIKQIESHFAGAALKRITLDVIVDLSISLPPTEEQQSIADYLDHETAKIDQLIAKQERLIELLKEKRQAVISRAVTKGLDPDAPMKDSGVDWLGEVPAYWDVARVKHIAKLESGHTPNKAKSEYWENCDIPWVSLNDSKMLAYTDYISDTVYKINPLGLANSSARLLPSGAVVFTRDATIGLAAITTRSMAVSQHLIAWLCKKEKILPEFLLLAFYAMENELDRFTFGATIKTIGMPDVRKLTIAVPPIHEQKAIINHVFALKGKLQKLHEKTERRIGLLKEHRSALISAAVTGKIDVRNWKLESSAESERQAATA